MNNDVKSLIDDVIRAEGGYVNHPNDRGGPTKYGITLKTLEAWRDEELNEQAVRLLDKDEAEEIYEANYYIKPGINYLPDMIQPVVFDMAVNMGPKTAIKILQRVIHKMGTPILVDGNAGPKTRQSAVIACNVYGWEVVRQICALRVEHYREIVDHDHKQGEFLAGWVNRANSFLV